jgi:pimeloyl-ACP methyl ester carboxylesterase
VPPRALCPDAGPPPETAGSWADYGADVVRVLAAHGIDRATLVGHSFGGVASLVAAVRWPEAVRALVLLDPTIFPPDRMDAVRAAKAAGWNPPHPLVPRTRERRRSFASRAEAFGYWRDRPLFADWSDESLGRYVEGALRPAGDGFTLRWTPEWEAFDYESFYPDTWRDVPRLDPALPVLVVGGERSDTFLPESSAMFARLVPHATVLTLSGGGHLFPQAQPERTAAFLVDWLAEVDVS